MRHPLGSRQWLHYELSSWHEWRLDRIRDLAAETVAGVADADPPDLGRALIELNHDQAVLRAYLIHSRCAETPAPLPPQVQQVLERASEVHRLRAEANRLRGAMQQALDADCLNPVLVLEVALGYPATDPERDAEDWRAKVGGDGG